MTIQDQTTSTTVETPVAEGVLLTDHAAAKVRACSTKRVATTCSCAFQCSPADALVCATSCSSTSAIARRRPVLDFDGVNVVVDRMSLPYLHGATIDFVDTIEKQGFTIDNPKATGSCACGDSFH